MCIRDRVSALLLHLGQPRLLLVRSEDLGLLLFSHGDDPEAAGGARGHLHGAGSEAHGNTAARGDTPAIDRGEEERGVSVGSVKVVRQRHLYPSSADEALVPSGTGGSPGGGALGASGGGGDESGGGGDGERHFSYSLTWISTLSVLYCVVGSVDWRFDVQSHSA